MSESIYSLEKMKKMRGTEEYKRRMSEMKKAQWAEKRKSQSK